jgi:hypothetical protein
MTQRDTLSKRYGIEGTFESLPILLPTIEGAIAGNPSVVWLNRAEDRLRLKGLRPEACIVYVAMKYIRFGGECPIVHIIETAGQVFTAQAYPPSWTRQQRRILERDADRFAREMARGFKGKVLDAFEMPDFPELLTGLTELVYAAPTTTH